jgi:hypothetical protein
MFTFFTIEDSWKAFFEYDWECFFQQSKHLPPRLPILVPISNHETDWINVVATRQSYCNVKHTLVLPPKVSSVKGDNWAHRLQYIIFAIKGKK